MNKYTGLDTKSLTLEDALSDDDWGKSPRDYLRYITIDFPVLQSVAEDFSTEEMRRFIVVLSLYFVDGVEPDYKSIPSSGVKQAVRMTISAQKERLDSLYLTHYKQFVAAMQKREKQDTNTS